MTVLYGVTPICGVSTLVVGSQIHPVLTPSGTGSFSPILVLTPQHQNFDKSPLSNTLFY